MTRHVLISPLGFAAGAVSGVYFALREQGIGVEQVITVGTDHPGVRDAARVLIDLFRKVEGVSYEAKYIAAEDLWGAVVDASGPFAARMGLYVDRARSLDGTCVHIAVTGGRSGMGALAALAAQIYGADKLYHLWVSPEIEREGIARARPDVSNPYVNPTLRPGEWELVELPFINLRSELQHLAGLEFKQKVSHYFPAGLPTYSAALLLHLGAEWRAVQDVALSAAEQAWLRYERGARKLIQRVPLDNPDFGMVRVHAELLMENLARARVLGDDVPRAARREEILGELDGLARKTLDQSFEAICKTAAPDLDPTAIFRQALALMQTAGMLSRDDVDALLKVATQPVGSGRAQRALQRAAENDEMGYFGSLTKKDKAKPAPLEITTVSVSVATFILNGLELWLKVKGIIS